MAEENKDNQDYENIWPSTSPIPEKKKETRKVLTLNHLRNYFLLFTIIGISGIVFSAFTDYFNQVITTGFSLAVMIFYFITSRMFLKHLAVDTVGDSNYYLGFIFTLVALVLSLITFEGATGAEGGYETLIKQFGVAIVTTLAGLIFRILISQFTVTPDEIDEEIRNQLSQTIISMSVELKQAEENLANIVNTSQNRLNQLTEGSYEILNEFFQTQAVSFKNASNEHVDSLTQVTLELKKQSQEIITTFQNITNDTKEFRNALTNITKTSENLDSSLSNVNAIVTNDEFNSKVTNFNQLMDRLNQRLQDMGHLFSESKETIKEDADFIKFHKEQLRKSVDESLVTVKEVQNNIVTLSKFIIDKLS